MRARVEQHRLSIRQLGHHRDGISYCVSLYMRPFSTHGCKQDSGASTPKTVRGLVFGDKHPPLRCDARTRRVQLPALLSTLLTFPSRHGGLAGLASCRLVKRDTLAGVVIWDSTQVSIQRGGASTQIAWAVPWREAIFWPSLARAVVSSRGGIEAAQPEAEQNL